MLVCFIAIGMFEASSCDATVTSEAQRVRKGDELGMQHDGGWSYRLAFHPEAKIVLNNTVSQSLKDGKTRVLLNNALAHSPTESG